MLVKYLDEDGMSISRISMWEVCSKESNNEKNFEIIKTFIDRLEELYYPFYEKVDEIRDNAKDYYNIVPVPMHLNLIYSRVKNFYYTGIASITYDIDLIYKNCVLYNGENSNIVKASKRLVNEMKGLLNENRRSTRMTRSLEIPREIHEEGKSLRRRGNNNNVDVEISIGSESDESEPKQFLKNKRTRNNKFRIKY